MTRRERESNPFEDPAVAREWIRSVEGERGGIRDRYLYPVLRRWLAIPGIRSVLDLGCGQGIAARFCLGKRYVGIDASAPLIRRARARYGRLDHTTRTSGPRFLTANAYALPFPAGSFDGVFSLNLWFHLEDPAAASRELARVLRPGGTFLIVTANPDSYDIWLESYRNCNRSGKRVIGEARIPLVTLRKNALYLHSHEEILSALKEAGLHVTRTRRFAPARHSEIFRRHGERPLFRYYRGKRPLPA